MNRSLRRFNPNGLHAFKVALDTIRAAGNGTVPSSLLEDPSLTERVAEIAVSPRPFKHKQDLALWLQELLEPLRLTKLSNDVGLWSWLSAALFDQLCPTTAANRRKVLATPLYIPDVANWQRVYRHLLAGPYELLRALPEYNRLLLHTPIHQHPDIIEQVSGRLYIIRIPALRETMDRLYYDEARQTYKRGTVGKGPGSIFRLIALAQQLDCTLDLHGLTGDQFLELLPREFDVWRKGTFARSAVG